MYTLRRHLLVVWDYLFLMCLFIGPTRVNTQMKFLVGLLTFWHTKCTLLDWFK